MPRYLPDYERQSLDVSFEDGTTINFNLEECPRDIKDRLALHGAVQHVAAAANRADDHESAFEYADDAICHINECFPYKRHQGEPRNIVIRAIARHKEWPLDQALLKWGELSLEKQGAVRNNRRVKAVIASIRAERAQQYASESATKRKKHYTHEILTATRKAILHFANGKDLEINLDNVASVSALAVFGAKQKVADSFAAERDCRKQIELARQVVSALYIGHWTAKNTEIADAPKRFAAELVSRLVNWMRWPRAMVETVVEQFDEQEQTVLSMPRAKQVLAACAHEAGREGKAGPPSPREMYNLLHEVLDRLGGVSESQNGVSR